MFLNNSMLQVRVKIFVIDCSYDTTDMCIMRLVFDTKETMHTNCCLVMYENGELEIVVYAITRKS